jgi:hypothetical protein
MLIDLVFFFPVPMQVVLGEGRIIRGMEKGMFGMCLGEIRQVLIPPAVRRHSSFSSFDRLVERDTHALLEHPKAFFSFPYLKPNTILHAETK